MADNKTVAQEDAADALTGAELVRIVQDGNSVRTTAQAIADLAPGGSGSFIFAKQVWVEAAGNDGTGEAGNPNLPFLTLNAALDATTGSVVIHIGVGVFAVPTNDSNPVSSTVPNPASKLRPGLWFKGTQVPVYDSYTAPTQLVGGTILNGEFIVNGINTRNGFTMTDLGVDNGPVRASGDADGFAVFNYGQVAAQPMLEGIVIDNVATLCRSASASAHGFCFENCHNPKVSRIQTYYGLHGVAWKCVGGYARGIATYGHEGDLIIIKESNFGNASAPCNNTLLADIVGGALSAGDTNVGLFIETSGTNDMFNVTVENMRIVNAMAVAEINLITDSSATGGMRNIALNNIQTISAEPTVSITVSGGPMNLNSITLNWQALNGEVTIASSGSVTMDWALGDSFRVVLSGNTTLQSPSHAKGGQVKNLRIKQDGTGGHTIALASNWKPLGGVAYTFSTAPNAEDFLSIQYSAAEDTFVYSGGTV